MRQVAQQLGIGYELVRKWVKQAEIDRGRRPGATTVEQRRIAELERENRELRRANAQLAAVVVGEADRELPAARHGLDSREEESASANG